MNHHALLLALSSFSAGFALMGAMYAQRDRLAFWFLAQLVGCFVNVAFAARWLWVLQ